ncbi:MAG: peroxiredoxin, partial [Halioglobus sp.]|nr:peroxiredoxin [Halioglobus sp.]
MLQSGTQAPEFALPDHTGKNIELTQLLADGPLILYFYPSDFTPGCTKEACVMRDMFTDLRSVGLQIAGVSPQDSDSHAKFRKEYRLPFTLLSDVDKVTIKMYEVDGPFGVGVRRATFLIDQDRIIQDAVLADVMISRHA